MPSYPSGPAHLVGPEACLASNLLVSPNPRSSGQPRNGFPSSQGIEPKDIARTALRGHSDSVLERDGPCSVLAGGTPEESPPGAQLTPTQRRSQTRRSEPRGHVHSPRMCSSTPGPPRRRASIRALQAYARSRCPSQQAVLPGTRGSLTALPVQTEEGSLSHSLGTLFREGTQGPFWSARSPRCLRCRLPDTALGGTAGQFVPLTAGFWGAGTSFLGEPGPRQCHVCPRSPSLGPGLSRGCPHPAGGPAGHWPSPLDRAVRKRSQGLDLLLAEK